MHSLMNHDDSNSGAANTTKDAVLATEATVPETSTVLVPNLENPDGDTPSDITAKPENEGLCGAQSKTTGKPCRNVAGKGTCHRGQGRCRFHVSVFKQVRVIVRPVMSVLRRTAVAA